MIPSGVVPRELVPGVVWDEVAEALYQEKVEALRPRFVNEDQVQTEARWQVELVLHRRFLAEQMRAASNCFTAADKRRLYAWWQQRFGNERAQTLANYAKSDSLRKASVAWR